MSRLEERGLAFGKLLFGSNARSTRQLSQSSGYASARDVLWDELRAIEARDPQAGVSVARFSHRLFDRRFLDLESARFRLIAVSNRVDRRPFSPKFCGETRLVYRLEYDTSDGPASLPFTWVAEFHGPSPDSGGCAHALDGWRVPDGDDASRAAFLLGEHGALAPRSLDRNHLLQFAVNFQTVRWPSAVRPDLGGHAEYLLRAFSWNENFTRLVPRPLENTPDLERLGRDAALRARFEKWLAASSTLSAAERGVALLPDEFAAKRALSVSPRGLSRLQNRPFSSAAAILSLAPKLTDESSFGSPEAYLRRLDESSCNGCHQAHSIAGFHLLGDDLPDAPVGTALAASRSPHLTGELERRESLFAAWSTGPSARVDELERVPFSSRTQPRGLFGASCGLPDAVAPFDEWSCDAGLTCQPYDLPAAEKTRVGVCLPNRPSVGAPCEFAPLTTTPDPLRDRGSASSRLSCADGQICNRNAVGFPGGMCTASCNSTAPDVRCGPIAVLDPFNACLARREPFVTCLAEHTRPSGLRACSEDAPCRDDYACVRASSGGVCVPPYFLFQLRVDGHVIAASQ